MQTLSRSASSVFTLAPARDIDEFSLRLAKCTGKHKPSKIKADRRVYPTFYPGMSTADYVRLYEQSNKGGRDSRNKSVYIGFPAVRGFFGLLNAVPCTLYTGQDTHEIIDSQVIEFPAPIEARELHGAELEAAHAEFEAIAA